jgi:hypothetical protein
VDADGDKIRTWLGVIIIRESVLLVFLVGHSVAVLRLICQKRVSTYRQNCFLDYVSGKFCTLVRSNDRSLCQRRHTGYYRRNLYSKNLYLMRTTARYHTNDREGACADFNHIATFLRKPLPSEAANWCS